MGEAEVWRGHTANTCRVSIQMQAGWLWSACSVFIVLLAPPTSSVGGERRVVFEVPAEALELHLEGW